MLVRKLINVTALFVIMGVCPAFAQNTQLLGSARSILLQSDVIFNKDRLFNSKPVPLFYIYQAGLLKYFHEVRSNPDIIIKFHKDVFLIDQEKISLIVFDADDNSVIYSEERKLVDEENDVNHLVARFLAAVKAERDLAAEAAAEQRKARAAEVEVEKEEAVARQWAEKDSKALKDAKVILSFYSSSTSLVKAIIEANRNNPNECHVYLRNVANKVNADVILEQTTGEGTYKLTLTARDTKEILHTEGVPEKSAKHAVASMSKWITSTPWE